MYVLLTFTNVLTGGNPDRILGTGESGVHVSWVASVLSALETTGVSDCKVKGVSDNDMSDNKGICMTRVSKQ